MTPTAGILPVRSAAARSDTKPPEKFVAIVPGATALTVMPAGASSKATRKVIVVSPRSLASACGRLVIVS